MSMRGMQVFEYYMQAKAQHPDIDEWLPESVTLEFGEDNLDTIMAAKYCFTSDMPWEDMRVFEKVVLVLNGRLVFGEIMQDLDVREIAYAVAVMKRLFPENLFNDEIAKYIAIEATQEGFVVLPPEIGFAQRFLPMVYLSREQEQVQMAYLQEVADYVQLIDRGDN